MLQSEIFPKTGKEPPREAESANHKLLVRAGFIDQLMTGSWTLLPLGWRVVEKINAIIREEINKTGAQEVLMPLLHPKAIWNETGRWEKAKEIMYQFKDHRGKEYALSFTHEEIFLDIVRKHITSYQDLPIALYHFSTKFRNEPRARSGILRGREFMMKDLYSVHATEEEFWKLNCNLTNAELKYEDFYVRQAFRAYRNTQIKRRDTSLTLKYKNSEELNLIQRSVSKGTLQPIIGDHQIEYPVAEKDRVVTILLGSQPSREGTLGYVRQFIQLANEIHVPTHLFVFCADHKPGSVSLMKAVSDTVAKTLDFPRHLTVIPMSFQSDKEIAPLFHRSDITCTRSGGQTAMEIMSVGTGDPWVHSEAKMGKGPLSEEALLAGIPVWESANAVYMQRMVGAKLVTPDSFIPYARKVLLGG